MLDQRVIDRVKRLLAKGKSSREIAAIATVSRETVSRVRKGLYDKPEKLDRIELLTNTKYAKSKRYYRCKGCGGLVKTPCMACGIRAQKERMRVA